MSLKTSDKRALREAADFLDEDAQALFESHSVNGQWSTEPLDKAAKRVANTAIRLAKRLRTIAGAES